jgi:hypothetical protein
LLIALRLWIGSIQAVRSAYVGQFDGAYKARYTQQGGHRKEQVCLFNSSIEDTRREELNRVAAATMGSRLRESRVAVARVD